MAEKDRKRGCRMKEGLRERCVREKEGGKKVSKRENMETGNVGIGKES